MSDDLMRDLERYRRASAHAEALLAELRPRIEEAIASTSTSAAEIARGLGWGRSRLHAWRQAPDPEIRLARNLKRRSERDAKRASADLSNQDESAIGDGSSQDQPNRG